MKCRRNDQPIHLIHSNNNPFNNSWGLIIVGSVLTGFGYNYARRVWIKVNTKKFRVLFFVEGFTDVRFVRLLAQAFDLTLVVPERQFCESGLDLRIAKAQIPVQISKIRGGRLRYQLASLLYLLRNLKNFDCVLAQELLRGALNVSIATRIWRKPMIALVATDATEYFSYRHIRGQISAFQDRIGKTAIWVLNHLNARAATLCLGVGPHLEKVVHRLTPRSGSFLYYGVDVDTYQPKPSSSRDVLRSRLKLPDDQFIVLLASRISHEKDPETALRGVALARRRGLNAVLLNLSGGFEQFLNLAQNLGLKDTSDWVMGRQAVHPLLELPDYFHASDAVVQTSLAEGFGLSTWESLCCGVPVVATATGGLTELKGFAQLIPMRDPEALAQALLWIKENPAAAKQQALSGREEAVRRYSTNIALSDLQFKVNQTIKASRR